MCNLRKLLCCGRRSSNQNGRQTDGPKEEIKQVKEPTRRSRLSKCCSWFSKCFGRRRSTEDSDDLERYYYQKNDRDPDANSTGVRMLVHDVWPSWSNEFGRRPIYMGFFSTILEDEYEWEELDEAIWPRRLVIKEDENKVRRMYLDSFRVEIYPWAEFLLPLDESPIFEENVEDEDEILPEHSRQASLDISIPASLQDSISPAQPNSPLELPESGPGMMAEVNDLASNFNEVKNLSNNSEIETDPTTSDFYSLALDTNDDPQMQSVLERLVSALSVPKTCQIPDPVPTKQPRLQRSISTILFMILIIFLLGIVWTVLLTPSIFVKKKS